MAHPNLIASQTNFLITATAAIIAISNMKYTNYIGVVAALALIAICFMPWVYVVSIHLQLTGVYTGNTHFGKPGLMNIVMAVVSIIFFLVPTITAKRVNLFIGAFNMAWAVRNYLVVTQCQMGECPEKKAGIWLLLIVSAVLLIMSLFPNVKLKNVGDN